MGIPDDVYVNQDGPGQIVKKHVQQANSDQIVWILVIVGTLIYRVTQKLGNVLVHLDIPDHDVKECATPEHMGQIVRSHANVQEVLSAIQFLEVVLAETAGLEQRATKVDCLKMKEG